MLVAWALAPVLFAALALAIGLLVERAGALRIPVPLLFGVGFCGIVCASQVLVRVAAPATPWVVLVLAVAGLALGRRRLGAVDRIAVALGVAVFALYAAPTVLTGSATFLGYGNQGDGGFHFLLVDQLLSHGYDLSRLDKSSFSLTVKNYLDTAYPTGAHTALGAWRGLTGTDVAWLLQPYLSLLTTFSALGLYALVRPHSRDRWPAALTAGLAASALLIYAYANNQQALKEMAALLVIVTAVGSVGPLLSSAPTWRAGIPAAVVVAGGLGVLSVALAPWLAPLLLIALVGLFLRGRPVALVAVFAVVAITLSLPALTRLGSFVKVTNVSLTGAQEFGNLSRPLPFVESLGVWPADDFRNALPTGVDLDWLLIGAVALAALLGVIAAFRRGAWPVLLFLGVSLFGFLAVAGRASPWAYAKALVLFSPVALLLAGFAAIALWDERRRAEAGLLLALLSAGVLWSDARHYHASSPAPKPRLQELARIGERFAGQGPLLYLDADEFAKHFLRRTDPSGTGEAYNTADFRFTEGHDRGGTYTYDADELVPDSLAGYRLMAIRYGPEASRPPSGWERRFHGSYYDVWARAADAPSVPASLSLGTGTSAATQAPCDAVRALARQADDAGGRLAYAPRAETAAFIPGPAAHPESWRLLTGSEEDLIQIGPGIVRGPVTTEAGRFTVWMRGSVERAVHVRIDGRDVGAAEHALSLRRAPMRVGTVELDAGEHAVEIVVGGGSAAPGDGGINRVIGPVLLAPEGDPTDVPVRTVAPSGYRSLCGQSLDWVQVVA